MLIICDTAGIDLVPYHVTIAPGEENNILTTGEELDYSFRYDIVKGSDSVSDPMSFTYVAVLSLTKDLTDPDNLDLTDGEQSHNVADGTTVTCRYFYLSCLIPVIVL